MKLVRHALFPVVFYAVLFVLFFSPVVFRGKLLAVGIDGLHNYLPYFYSHKVLWDTLLFSGFPMLSDPQVMNWYPPAAILSQLPGTWNVFIIFAYVAGSSFTYGYVYGLTASRLAALVSGLIFGMSGFMMSQLTHAVIIHAAVWLPLIIWCLESLRRKLSAGWLVVGSVSVAMSFLGGQPQIFTYALILSGAYVIAVGWKAPVGRWRFYFVSLLVVILGCGLAAVQIIPTAELFDQSVRAGYSFQGYVSHSLPPKQALTMIFPLVFGVRESGALPYFGAVNQIELTGYIGLLPIMLVAIAVVTERKKTLCRFWLCAALLALFLVMGNATPLARLIYHVPILNSFRAPARHFLEFTFAFSVLAGLGVAAIVRLEVSLTMLRRLVLVASLAMLICIVLLFVNSSYLAVLAAEKGISRLSLLPWVNRAVGIPLVIFVLAVAALLYWYKNPRASLRKALLLSVLIVDLASCSWFYPWRYSALDKNDLVAPEIAGRYKSSLGAANQRLMSYRGAFGSNAEVPPNLSRLWGVPSASGYNPLILARLSRMLSMTDGGTVGASLRRDESDSSLDLMAIRYLFLPPHQLIRDKPDVTWFAEDMQQWLGSGCNQAPRNSFTLSLPTPVKSRALGVVSRLACSTEVPDGAEVARVRLTTADGEVQTRSLVAGRDASEWAYDCGRVKVEVRHQRAEVFSNYPARMYEEPCEGHFYVTRLALDRVKDIKTIEFEWVAGPASIIVEKLSLINETSSFPLDLDLIDQDGWRLVEETAQARVYENLRVMPRTWLASEVIEVNQEQALNTIKTGKLPDGVKFDPSRTALVETPLALSSQNVDSNASATVTALTATHMRVRTSSTTSSFLVTSDAFYPGWRAIVDGQETPLYRADYAIRGVMLPPGEHTVSFDYNPRRFYLGAGVSILSLLALGALAWIGRARRSTRAS